MFVETAEEFEANSAFSAAPAVGRGSVSGNILLHLVDSSLFVWVLFLCEWKIICSIAICFKGQKVLIHRLGDQVLETSILQCPIPWKLDLPSTENRHFYLGSSFSSVF